jgi:hypothetical protein
MTQEQFQVRCAKTIWPLGNPSVVIAVGKTKKDHEWWGEYYIFLDGPEPAFLTQRMMLDMDGFPERIKEGALQFMLDEINLQAENRISDHHYAKHKASGRDFYLQKIELLEGENSDILKLWIRGKVKKEIELLRDSTACGELKGYVESITHLPPITSVEKAQSAQ